MTCVSVTMNSRRARQTIGKRQATRESVAHQAAKKSIPPTSAMEKPAGDDDREADRDEREGRRDRGHRLIAEGNGRPLGLSRPDDAFAEQGVARHTA